MNLFGMIWVDIFALLLSAMGPVGITMSYLPIARALPPAMQRQLAWRTVLVGFIVAVGLLLLGGGVVRRFHLSLAVPALISPSAVALLFTVSAFVPSLAAALIFVGMVGVVLLIDLGLMLLSTYVARYVTQPILEVLQKIFGFILLTFGIQLVLQALAKLGIMKATGF